MQSVAFTHRIPYVVLAAEGSQGRQAQYVANTWRNLNDRLAGYLADHLPETGFQLLRVLRGTTRDPRSSEIVLTLMLEVGEVRERPFIDVAVNATTAQDTAAALAWNDLTGEILAPLTLNEPRDISDQRQQASTRRSIRENLPYENIQDTAPAARRHILPNKQPQPA